MDQAVQNANFDKSPGTPYERLKKAIEHLQTINPKLTLSQIMKEVGYSGAASHLSEMMSGKKKITTKFLNLLQLRYFISKRWIETGKDEIFVKPAVAVNSALTRYYKTTRSPEEQDAWNNTQDRFLAQILSQVTGKPLDVCLAEIDAAVRATWSRNH